jgi:hypothetical protein
MPHPVYGERRKKFPKLPKSCLESHCALEDIKEKIITNRKENFLMINDVESNIIIFSCDVNLKHLCRCTRTFMDGTFKYCPKYFLQLFTLHGYYNGHYNPLAFCLLKDKLTETYAKCLTILLKKCKEINLKFQPEEIVIDFEKSIHNAVKIVWNVLVKHGGGKFKNWDYLRIIKREPKFENGLDTVLVFFFWV